MKFIFVFAHNSNIHGYMYQHTKWVHVIDSELSARFLECYINLTFENIIDGVNVFLLNDPSDVDLWLKNRILEIRSRDEKCCILCKNNDVEKKLEEFTENNFINSKRVSFVKMNTIL